MIMIPWSQKLHDNDPMIPETFMKPIEMMVAMNNVDEIKHSRNRKKIFSPIHWVLSVSIPQLTLLFLVLILIITKDIIRYYLIQNSTALKLLYKR